MATEEEELAVARANSEGEDDKSLKEAVEKDKRKEKRKKRLLKEAEKADRRGVCYLSRVPPHMDPLKLRQILSQYGEIQRLYLTPEDPAAQVRRKKSGGFRGQEFSEGWVEFTDKKIAKRVARMLNGEQIGGRKRSSFYYDLWNIKYLSKFKWDDLTEEIAYKNAIREQKLALELSAAKRERDFYLSKVDQSKALSKIEERLKKKQKVDVRPKVMRQFPQKKPVVNETGENKKAQLSSDILAGVFGGSS
ncbi:UNVERIFIED_CONTAM: Pre-rRNA-processing protein ESF2 [Sesamum radiatum]|uniref:Pre-rRNA-processing protein ESF2 n=1 Tax=Sesamum radiatum TaxID=300843 RepID=A0AAW2RAV4_SESRA